jgi:hypothetical protein
MPQQLDLTYPNILSHLKFHLHKGRTESRAFLAWFLENFYRLEDFQAQDAVCDGPDDKGVDGIYVDDNFERIDVFQSKLLQNSAKSLGDTQLKEFAGTLDQFRTEVCIKALATTTSNAELRQLIQDENVADKVSAGYTLRGIFVTNAKRDQNASAYLATRSDIALFDALELKKLYLPAEPAPPAQKPFTFDTFGFDVAEYNVGAAKVVTAPLLASELVNLDGLANGELFAWNVRQSLGRTKVNKDIAKSIRDPAEHKYFLLFHNGLTVLCSKLALKDDKVTIEGYAVVNGCQSLTSLYENRAKISQELRVLARLIEVPPNDPLAERITHHSNNQNSISARDLQSNSAIQRRLQSEFAQKYANKVFYRIKRGEIATVPTIIDNEDAGRSLLAFDLQTPWACHQGYRVFDELHAEIFARPEVTADRIYSRYLAYQAVLSAELRIDNELLRAYRLTDYVLLFLLRQALDLDPKGRLFVTVPEKLLAEKNGEDRLGKALTAVLEDLVVDVNAEIKERDEAKKPVDFKREFKSPNAVRDFAKNILPIYTKAIQRKRASAFGEIFG